MISTPSDREITITRTFNAPRQRVLDALTEAHLLACWLADPPRGLLAICEINLHVNSSFRFVWRSDHGDEIRLRGVCREILPYARIVNTEISGKGWTSGDVVCVLELIERNGKTTLTNTILYASKAARDDALAAGFTESVLRSYERLETCIVSLPQEA
jgi:uncharacterized protein YndB with AHSA1/START domain